MSTRNAVRTFNKTHPVGSVVLYQTSPAAEWRETRTRSEAWALGGHTAVVMVEGVSGCVALFALRDPSPAESARV